MFLGKESVLLYRVIYSSVASEIMPKSKLYRILMEARSSNQRNEITGVLIFAEGRFLQVIEGKAKAVESIMTGISLDPRHEEIRILHEGVIESRSFPNWLMAYLTSSQKELADWAGLRSTATLDEVLNELQASSGSQADLLRHFMEAIAQPARALEL